MAGEFPRWNNLFLISRTRQFLNSSFENALIRQYNYTRYSAVAALRQYSECTANKTVRDSNEIHSRNERTQIKIVIPCLR